MTTWIDTEREVRQFIETCLIDRLDPKKAATTDNSIGKTNSQFHSTPKPTPINTSIPVTRPARSHSPAKESPPPVLADPDLDPGLDGGIP